MKEKKECKVVQDLLPNYIEKLTNEETDKYIKEHMNGCEECKKILDDMQNELKVSKPQIDKREVKYLKKYRRKLRILAMILLTIVAIYIIIVIRRFIILLDLQNKANKNFNANNCHLITTHTELTDDAVANISEIYYKEGKYITKISHLSKDNITKFITFFDGNISNNYIENDIGKFVYPNSNATVMMTPHLAGYSKIELLFLSLGLSVKNTECNGKRCYLVGRNK